MNVALKDFFMGVVHIFVIFLPGSVILLTGIYVLPDLKQDIARLGLSDIGMSVLFVGASYFLGHLVSLLASKIEDTGFNKFHKRESSPYHAAIRRAAHEICINRLGRDVVISDKLRKWCSNLVRQDGGILQASVDTKDADRRFFRNIRLALVLPVLLLLGGAIYIAPDRIFVLAWEPIFLAATLIILIMCAEFRYRDQDKKFTTLVFESLIALDAAKPTHNRFSKPLPTHAGGVVYRIKSGITEYLVVTASKNNDEWVLPKGHIEKGETPEEAAIREVREETGVTAKLIKFLDFQFYKTPKEKVRLAGYLMENTSESCGGDAEKRNKMWLTYDEAKDKLTFPESKSILGLALDYVQERSVGRLKDATLESE